MQVKRTEKMELRMVFTVHCIVYTIVQGSPTFCGRWAKKWENKAPSFAEGHQLELF